MKCRKAGACGSEPPVGRHRSCDPRRPRRTLVSMWARVPRSTPLRGRRVRQNERGRAPWTCKRVRLRADAPEVWEPIRVPAGTDGRFRTQSAVVWSRIASMSLLGGSTVGEETGNLGTSDRAPGNLGGAGAVLGIVVLVQTLGIMELREHIDDLPVDGRVPARDSFADERHALPWRGP